ncbi:MAG TPA: protein-glutamate O-methyltransferase CheR [Thermoanaerobaculia bacterium]|nr:protein-glutamate O-methyltransferase CheR [Thermoanaerobaculia bacterium]
MNINDRDYREFQQLIERETGIYLSNEKKPLLVGRLARRLREREIPTFRDYLSVIARDAAERTQMIDAICTNETRFFREPQQFTYLEQQLVPQWRAERREVIRVWSAACSTGEEPYSLGMTLLAHFPPSSGTRVEILATDLSTKVLSAARTAVWPLRKAEPIPPHHLREFMLRGRNAQQGNFAAGEALRSVVRFRHAKLDGALAAVTEEFDLIFCRNVLIYFRAETKEEVLRAIASRLTAGGSLFLGQAESWPSPPPGMRVVRSSVYRRDVAETHF